jgi:hypothetical protein
MSHFDMLKMIAKSHAKDFLCLLLAYDEAVEMAGDIDGLQIEGEFLGWGWFASGGSFAGRDVFRAA